MKHVSKNQRSRLTVKLPEVLIRLLSSLVHAKDSLLHQPLSRQSQFMILVQPGQLHRILIIQALNRSDHHRIADQVLHTIVHERPYIYILKVREDGSNSIIDRQTLHHRIHEGIQHIFFLKRKNALQSRILGEELQHSILVLRDHNQRQRIRKPQNRVSDLGFVGAVEVPQTADGRFYGSREKERRTVDALRHRGRFIHRDGGNERAVVLEKESETGEEEGREYEEANEGVVKHAAQHEETQ